MSNNFSKISKLLKEAGQEHVLQFWDELGEDERKHLAEQVLKIQNFKHLNLVLKDSLALLEEPKFAEKRIVEPPPAQSILDCSLSTNKSKLSEYEKAGLVGVLQGKVAVLLLAGGSGTRLGVSMPKGMFVCPQLKQPKSLFQLHSEKILKVEQLALGHNASSSQYNHSIPFLIMTSDQNHSQTKEFFEKNNYFRLKKEQVHFFPQSSLPCYDEKTGKILMESKSSMCVAPGGNGGVYQSLESHGMLEVLQQKNVSIVQIFGVDNILAAVADPIFFGFALQEQKAVVVKTTPKLSPEERVGVFAKINEKWGVLEYTEVGSERSQERDSVTNELRFNSANLAMHVCSLGFLEFAAKRMSTETLFHAARKNIPTIHGNQMGVKLEAFIFDLFAYSDIACDPPNEDAFGIMQVDRTKEFAPIKNNDAAATDSPSTAVKLMHKLHSRWVVEAAREVLACSSPSEPLQRLLNGEVYVEISPLISFRGEGLKVHLVELLSRVEKANNGDIIVLEFGAQPNF